MNRFIVFLTMSVFLTNTYALRVLHYNSGNSSEKVVSIPITTSARTAPKNVIFSLELNKLKKGEILQIANEFQVTEDNNYNVGFSSLAILTTSPTSTIGVPITEANGENITNDMHHHKRITVGTYVTGENDIGTRYINIVGYAYSTNALEGHTLTVNQDYGRLSVIRFYP